MHRYLPPPIKSNAVSLDEVKIELGVLAGNRQNFRFAPNLLKNITF